MNKDEVLSYFGGVSNLARLLGISHASVSGWGSVIPKGRAFEIQTITNNVLKVDPTLYAKPNENAA
ncbi:Phage transcriptional regulator, Cro-like protein [Enterobacter sp. FY-07]|uniref:Cro/CI family transcriptional regulator n=1 Tax=Kosakonia oryzendophytica TaxID=1005665 RepID=UPI000778005F|nr:Cro/CI family transcriptional regulator [Kosakonia oryzendophytica]AMO47591.1 Phage transcriptional regulator, Cro-like protein [Enterobacter sp. FY-07]WBT59305.1 Cro/CI family transcriptional regulator [Kosakonia oryzendophytica]